MATVRLFIVSIVFFANLIGLHAQHFQFKGGHSHNDYYRENPLFDALEHDMVSIEVDIFHENGKLLVGHDLSELSDDKTIESLYLEPLRKLVDNNGHAFGPIILLVDFKNDPIKTYQALKQILKPYSNLLSSYKNNVVHKGMVTIIISGDRPIETIRGEAERYVFIDGRKSELENKASTNLFPLISESWKSHFNWYGKGKMPADEYQKLVDMVNKSHKQNKMIRFWGIPNDTEHAKIFWSYLQKAGVDLIGCDCPECLNEFLNMN